MAKRRRRKYKKKKIKFELKLNSKLIWALIFSLFSIVLLFGLVYAIYTLEMFKVKEENIKSNISLSRSLKNDIIGKSLFTLDIESISAELLKEYPGYKKIYVIKKFPSSLMIDAKKRGFFAQVKAKRFYPLDREGVVLSDGKIEAYGLLIPIEINGRNRSFKKGDIIRDRRLEYAFDLIDALGQEQFLNKFKVKLINVTNLAGTYFLITRIVSAEQNIKIIIGDRDFNERINLLKDVIDQELKEKMPLVEYIDLRHKKVYVGFRR